MILLGGEEGSLDQRCLSWMLVNPSNCGLPRESPPTRVLVGIGFNILHSRYCLGVELITEKSDILNRLRSAHVAIPGLTDSILVLGPLYPDNEDEQSLAMPDRAKAQGPQLPVKRSIHLYCFPCRARSCRIEARVAILGLIWDCHLAVALASCLVAIWVKAFADITVAWTTCGVSPPATGARLVNPAERNPNGHEPPMPLPLALGSTTYGPSDLGCSSAKLLRLRETPDISPDLPTWSHSMAQDNLVNTRRRSREVRWVFGYTQTDAHMGSGHIH